ncbi:TniB family NTP-binding protein [Terrihalobacillus insolitus]|uniref:TniB family NTP-binding protein n=1 Tax=Terrihalobacillus insolitus TaxID=2950438 RepID=UPI0023407035|nr:TniB family NTP-binding protein [Terrihalobacillus insolitus]MDC3414770.1 TniB family NTP-binding protein [Terrihalobacillus insolitus]
MPKNDVINPFIEFANRVANLHADLPEVESIYNAMDSHMRIKGKTRHLFVTGPSNVGKTRMAENYRDKHKAYTIDEDDGTEVDLKPVILMETPHPFTFLEFYHELISALGAPRLSGVPRVNDLKNRAYHLIERQKVKMIIIDEINNIMTSGFNNYSAMDAIKHLANKTNVTLVLMGTPESKELRTLDEQYKSRYRLRSISRFSKCDDEFCDYLMKIEEQLEYPNKIGLGNKETGLPQLLHYQSKGKMGFLIPIIQEAYDILGVNNDSFNDFDTVKLTPDVLNEAYKIIQGDVFDDKLD